MANPETSLDGAASGGVPDINRFVLEQGRLPKLGDAIPPWDYRGWLLWYCQLGHQHPGVVDRWGYYMRTVEAGQLLQEDIPQIQFCDCGDTVAFGMVRKALDLVYTEMGSWSAFPALIDWIAWGMALSGHRPPFSVELNERLYRHLNIGPLLLSPHDYLGALYAEGQGKWNLNAFYPTPHPVVECMTRITMEDVIVSIGKQTLLPDGRDPRTATVCDPCVGSARMLLHASNYSLCLYGCDIDPVCCRISAINGVLYAPWLAFPFRATLLGVAVPPPPPATLLPPGEASKEISQRAFRVDDRGQGFLFDLE